MILEEILAHKRTEVAERRTQRPLDALRKQVEQGGLSEPRGFRAALEAPGVSVIAEIKRKSPSGGALRPDASSADLGRLYAENGAAALSVLTDLRYFGGTDDDLVAARDSAGLPALRKDFVVDEYQVYEARALGADAVLLIVRALAQADLERLLRVTESVGMDALVETHSAEEVQRALDAGARVIGVNNRDLDRLVTDPTLALRLRHLVPEGVVYVAESGIHEPAQVASLADVGAHAVLIGESIVKDADPGGRLHAFVEAGMPRHSVASGAAR